MHFWEQSGGELPPDEVRSIVSAALTEDAAFHDVTSILLVPEGVLASAVMVARQPGVVAGLPVAREAFRHRDLDAEVELLVADGEQVEAGQELLRVQARARTILAAERVALNFVQRLSGTATLTRRFVDAVAGTGATIVDTRKTTPGLRVLEKYAVRCGGGQNHRFDLGKAVLVKDNHWAAVAAAGLRLSQAIASAPGWLRPGTVEIEVDDLAQLPEALAAKPDAILLDNMPPAKLAEAVKRIRQRRRATKIEASGGVTLETVRAIAETGVDLISVGALTHSAPALDISLDFQVEPQEPGAPRPKATRKRRRSTK